MTLIGAWGLDNYNNFTEFVTQEPEWTDHSVGNGAPVLSTTGGRFGGGRFTFIPDSTQSDSPLGARLQFATIQPKTIFFGVSILIGDVQEAGNSRFLLFYGITNEHLRIVQNNSTGLVDVVILGSTVGSFTLTRNVWHRLEIKLTVDDTTGEVTIKLDETQVFTSTGIDTQSGSNAFTNRIEFQTETVPINSQTNTVIFDDIIINDDQGSSNNTFLGDLKIETLRPDANGDVTNFTPSAGSNFQNVDDSPGPDADTTFNESSTAGHQDLYTTTNLSGSPDTIYAVVIRASARKDDAGSRTIQLLSKTGTTTDVGTTQTLLTTYTMFQEIHEVDPDTTIAWTPTGVNGIQIGMENN